MMLELTYILATLAFFTNPISAQSRQPNGVVLNYYPGDHAHVQYGLPGRAVDGSYGYVTPEGTVVTVNYIADENGYRAQVFKAPSPTPFYTPIGWSSPSALSTQKTPESPAKGPIGQPRPGNQNQGLGPHNQSPRPNYPYPASYNPYHRYPHHYNRYWYERCRNAGQYNCHRYTPYRYNPHHLPPSTFYRAGQF